jgi:hypothetical protein
VKLQLERGLGPAAAAPPRLEHVGGAALAPGTDNDLSAPFASPAATAAGPASYSFTGASTGGGIAMPRAEEATAPRDATRVGIAVRCGYVRCWWRLVGARRPAPHGGRASIEREATAAASEASTEHRAGRLWAKARTQAATRPRQWTLNTSSSSRSREREEARSRTESSTQPNFLSLQLCFSSFSSISFSISLIWGLGG